MSILSPSRQINVSLIKPIDMGRIFLADSEERDRLPINIAHISDNFRTVFHDKTELKAQNVVVHFASLVLPIEDKPPNDLKIHKELGEDVVWPVSFGQYFQVLAEVERELTLGHYTPSAILSFVVGYIYDTRGKLWTVGSCLSHTGNGWLIGVYPFGSISWPSGYQFVVSRFSKAGPKQ